MVLSGNHLSVLGYVHQCMGCIRGQLRPGRHGRLQCCSSLQEGHSTVPVWPQESHRKTYLQISAHSHYADAEHCQAVFVAAQLADTEQA